MLFSLASSNFRAVAGAIGVAGVLACSPAAFAQSFRLTPDNSIPLQLAEPASGVIVGNPMVAGVTIQSPSLLFLTGRNYGSTSLTVVSASGRTLFSGRIEVAPEEVATVTLTRGAANELRYDCRPRCARTPTVGDEAIDFDKIVKHTRDRLESAKASAGGQ